MHARLCHAVVLCLLLAAPVLRAAEPGTSPAATVLAPVPMRTLAWNAALHARGPAPLVRVAQFEALFRNEARDPVGSVLMLADQMPLLGPVLGPVRRLAGERWNTRDSSKPGEFALCYRVSRVLGMQMIPGDLTPAKLPTPKMVSVAQMRSGIGVMAGLTLRLGGRK